MDWAAFFSGAAPIVVAIIGWQGWQRWFGRNRENAETLSLTQDVWANEFRRLEQRAKAADQRADLAEQRADANEAAVREAHRQISDLQDRIDEIVRELAQLRLREQVLTEALVDAGVEPNGWVERRMRQIESEQGDNPS